MTTKGVPVSSIAIKSLAMIHLASKPDETRTLEQLEAHYLGIMLSSPIAVVAAEFRRADALHRQIVSAEIKAAKAMANMAEPGEFDGLISEVAAELQVSHAQALKALDTACERIFMGQDSYLSASERLCIHHTDMSDYFERTYR